MWIAIVLSVLLVFSLVACVGKEAFAEESEKVLGTYDSTQDDLGGFIELKSGGKLSMDLLGGTEEEGTWELEGEALTLTLETDGASLAAQLKDNKIVLDLGEGVVLHFAK